MHCLKKACLYGLDSHEVGRRPVSPALGDCWVRSKSVIQYLFLGGKKYQNLLQTLCVHPPAGSPGLKLEKINKPRVKDHRILTSEGI